MRRQKRGSFALALFGLVALLLVVANDGDGLLSHLRQIVWGFLGLVFLGAAMIASIAGGRGLPVDDDRARELEAAKQRVEDERKRRDDAKRKEEHERKRADAYLAAPAHFAEWTAFAEGLGWTLDRQAGSVSGRYGGHRVAVSFPPTYLGGITHVRLHARRRLPLCHVRPSRWWELGKPPLIVLAGDVHLPQGLVAFLEQHHIELETAQQSVRCTLPRCDVELVRELMDHLVSFATAPASYRRPALPA